MASGILVVAIDLRLARKRPTRPALQRACLVRSAQSRCDRNLRSRSEFRKWFPHD
jgi:hypothetical protein